MIFFYVASIIYFRKNNVIRMFLWLRSVTKNKTSQLLHVKMYKKHISQILSTSVFLSFGEELIVFQYVFLFTK